MADIHNTLEDCKLASLAAENINFPSRLDFDVEYAGAVYQADQKSYEKMVQALSQQALPSNFYWVDKSNNKNPFSRADLENLVAIVFSKRFDLFNEHQIKKDNIKNAQTVEQIFS